MGPASQWAVILTTLTLYLVGKYGEHASEDFNLRVDKRIDDKLTPGNAKLTELLERTSTIEGEVKVLLAQKSIAASGKYAAQGKTTLAVEAMQKAASTFAAASEKKLPAPPEYFVDSIEIVNGVAQAPHAAQLSQGLQNVRLSLAQYRSSLVVAQVPYEHKVIVGPNSGLTPGKPFTMKGGYFDITQLPRDFVQSVPPNTFTLADNVNIQGATIVGGMQTLDGIHWSGVTFIGTHIKYRGGQLDLDHVTFVACTFDAPNNNRGAQFANYVALMEPQLQIQKPATHS